MDVAQIILTTINLLLLAWLTFFKSYFDKKGSNLADKQDIAEITQKIEGVKQEFSDKNELLKANLQHIISNQIQHSNEQRNAIIGFYDSFSKWVNVGLMSTKIADYSSLNVDELIAKERSLDQFFTETSITQGRISLLVENPEIITVSLNLVGETLKFNHWLQPVLRELRDNLQKEKFRRQLFSDLIKIKPLPVEAAGIAKETEQLAEERQAIYAKFYSGLNVEFGKILKASSPFILSVKKYLIELKRLEQ